MQGLFNGVSRGTETPQIEAEALPPPPGHDGLQQPHAASPRSGTHDQRRIEGTVPMSGWDADVDIARGHDGRIDRLVVRDASLSKVLALLAQTYNLNIVASNDIDAIISITLHNVPVEEALTAILSVANYTWVQRNGIILITSLSDGQLPADIQGREIQVFDLDFASAASVSEAVTGLLSPIGKVALTESDSADNRRTREMIVVEDVPEVLARVASYISQVDCPPRQVLLEAHILQVTLRDNQKNGVDFNAILANTGITIKTAGFAPPLSTVSNPDFAGPGFFATIERGDLSSVIEILQTTADTKTLGSPKILVLNQQEANIHVGEKLGYQTTQTTELQSSQEVQFLDVGVILRLTPRITRDNRVLLHVAPNVSTGAIDPLTLAPNSQETELETDVMLRDGQGMVIGGLIKEQDLTNQSKIPYLGDMWRVGFLFRKSDVLKERVEIIFAIVPRIQPYSADYHDFEQGELVKAETPIFEGPLCYTDRPWEARLPDGKRVARPYIPPRPILPQVDRSPPNRCEAPWPPYAVPRKPYPQQQLSGDFAGECAEPALQHPSQYSTIEPEMAGEFVPEYSDFGDGQADEMSIISDQP